MKFLVSLVVTTAVFFAGCATQRPTIGPSEFYPLMRLAVMSGDNMCVEFLLKAGADPDGVRDYAAAMKKHGYGVEPSYHIFLAAYAGELEVVKMLANAGANLNGQEGEGQTALWAASHKGHVEVVRFLLSQGARRDLKGEGRTPLEMALLHGFNDIADLLNQEPTRATTAAIPHAP